MYDQSERKRFLREAGYEPRTTAWRPDIAALEFENRLKADKYVAGTRYQACDPHVSLRFEPYSDSPVEDQLLFGDTFVAYNADLISGLAWGEIEHDHHVGFVALSGLTRDVREPTHWVSELSTPVLPRPDRKAEPVFRLHLNARVTVTETFAEDPIYVNIGDGHWVFIGDLRPIGSWLDDALGLYERVAGVTSYVWGGVLPDEGMDCSGKTLGIHRASGRSCFRDADQQEYDPNLGVSIEFDGLLSGLRRSDQVHFPDHVATMVDETRAIHAKGENVRRLIIEPIHDINEWRIRDCTGGVRTVKRF